MSSGIGQACPRCNDGILIELPSINKEMCNSCCSYFEWNLKDGQKSVTLDNYVEGLSNYGTTLLAINKKEENK